MSGKLDFIHDSEVFIDLYNVLDVDIEAKSEEIKSAYLKLVKIHHPDHGGNTEMYQRITRAYEILYNKDSRKDYDLYYLKKSMDEFAGDDLFRLKNDYKNYVDANTKPISEDKLNEMYADMFKDKEKYIEKKIEKNELEQRINDIGLERFNEDIESNDEKIAKIISDLNSKLDKPISISEFFEYCKYKNDTAKNNEIMVKELGTLDTLPGYGSNYTSFMSDNEFFGSNLYSDISNENNFINSLDSNGVNSDDFNSWRQSKKLDTKLSQSEIESYLLKRRSEEDQIFNEVETNLTNISKRREVQKFLNYKYVSEDILNYNPNIKLDNEPINLENFHSDLLDDNNSEEKIKIDVNKIVIENIENKAGEKKTEKTNEEIVVTKTKNVRKRELL